MMKLLDWLKNGKRMMIVLAALLGLALILSMASEANTASSQSVQEKRLCEVLSRIKGAGRVEAVLFYQDGAANAWENEKSVVTGAVVVADGAKDLEVRLALIRAVRTLLGLPETAVDVFQMEGSP